MGSAVHKGTSDARISPTEYARRHVIYRLNSTGGLIVMVVASLANADGRARTVQRFIAEDMGKSIETVKRHMRWLLSPESGPVLMKGGGRTYILVGYVAHDPYRCGNPECEMDFTHQLDSDRRRALARDRQRRRRERERLAAQSG